MVNNCCVEGCKRELAPGSGLSMHRFPKDPELKRKWLEVVPAKVTKTSVICSLHFKQEDFSSGGLFRRKLEHDAIPSIFPDMPRSRRVTEKQMEILVDFAVTNQRFTMGRFGGSVQGLSYGPKEARDAWDSVAVRLNEFGIKKTPDQWRRYWIEYKAKLRARAADSRREINNPGGKLVPLSDGEKQLVEIINRVAAEGVPVNVSDIQYSPSTDAFSPETKEPWPSLEVEWLDYNSESDEQLEGDEIDSSQCLDAQADSEPETFQSAETEDEVAEPVKKQRKKTKSSYMRHFQQFLGGETSQIKPEETFSLSEKYRELKGGSRLPEIPLHNNIVSTSSSSHATGHQYEIDKKDNRASLNKNKSNKTQDPDLAFFYSVLPEMKQMNPVQKRHFKMGVWSLLTQILQPNKMDSPSDHDYGLSQRR